MTKNGTSSKPEELPEGNSSLQPCQKHTFPKSERLYQKRAFEHLFDGSASFYFGKLWVIYSYSLPENLTKATAMVSFAVPKRSFKRANKRNLLRRRLKEAYRLNKHLLVNRLEEENRTIAFLVKYNSREIRSYKEIESDLIRVLKKLRKAE